MGTFTGLLGIILLSVVLITGLCIFTYTASCATFKHNALLSQYILKPRGNHPSACSGTPTLYNLWSKLEPLRYRPRELGVAVLYTKPMGSECSNCRPSLNKVLVFIDYMYKPLECATHPCLAITTQTLVVVSFERLFLFVLTNSNGVGTYLSTAPSPYVEPRTLPVATRKRSLYYSADILAGLESPPIAVPWRIWPLPFHHGRQTRRCRLAREGAVPGVDGRSDTA